MPTRREFLGTAAALAAAPRLAGEAPPDGRTPAMIVCMIRYQIDPFQKDKFARYAATWGRIIPRCGGQLVGYFLPHEGTNDIAWGLIALPDLASYERYRARLREDADARANFEFAQSQKFVLREERTFVQVVDGTFGIPAQG